MTAELLTALPRPERPQPAEGTDKDEGESIGEIFKEAREQRAADEARRGGGRTRSRSGGGRDGERRGPRREGEARGERKPRAPRPPRDPAVDADPAASAANPAAASSAPATLAGDADKAPRKRRRRRRGKPVEGAAANNTNVQAVTEAKRVLEASVQPVEAKPSLLARIGRGLRSLVTRGPSQRH